MNCVWHGTEKESRELIDVISRNCSCLYDPAGARTATCAPHRALIDDQHWLDALLFERSIKTQLTIEEWCLTPKPSPRQP
jgi:hypothetical protein